MPIGEFENFLTSARIVSDHLNNVKQAIRESDEPCPQLRDALEKLEELQRSYDIILKTDLFFWLLLGHSLQEVLSDASITEQRANECDRLA